MTPVATDPATYAGFRILVDEPAAKPLLGFRAYAKAFTEMIEHSRAQFAIGIFGSWGSGKTTLMRAIEHEVRRRPNLIPVWFNAWRYEREDHLIVPLLDTLRDELERHARSRSTQTDATTKQRAWDAAQAMGRAGRAIARGLKLKVGIPFTGIGLDADLKAIEDALSQPPPPGPMSFYHGAFTEMEAAVRKFGAGGERRIVVFIDDLDRCLPASALSVLESMKLFFDVEGFVFVVGLDQDVVQRAIGAKYGLAPERIVVLAPSAQPRESARPETPAEPSADAAGRDSGNSATAAGVDTSDYDVKKIGSEYVKKIFQVPFSLPRISTKNLTRFVDGILRAAGVPAEQQKDLEDNVRPHLIHLSGEGAINPREVKRLINAYTLQMKLLSAARVHDLSPQAVITLLTMSFRTEWRHLYDLLVADPGGFADAISAVQEGGTDESVKLWPGDQTVPRDFLEYVAGTGRALLDVDNLERYVASVEATRTATVELGPAHSLVVDLGRRIARMAETGVIGPERDRIKGSGDRLRESLTYLPSLPISTRVHQGADALLTEISSAPWDGTPVDVKAWATRNEQTLRGIYENLRQIRLLTDVGGHA
jgi:hypothetical protein